MWLQLFLLSIFNFHDFITYYKERSRDARYVCGFKWRYGWETHNLGEANVLKEPLESSPRLELIFFEIFYLNLI